MGRNPREEAAAVGADAAAVRPRSASPRSRRRAKVTRRQQVRIIELRDKVPRLGLRKIARAMGLSLWQVRVVLRGGHFGQLKKPDRCKGCGALIRLWPCIRCGVLAGGK